MSDSSIWDEVSGQHTIGKRAFIALITFWVFCAIGLTTLVATLTQGFGFNVLSFFAAFALSLVGVWITKSDSPLVSLFGFTILAGAFGWLLGPALAQYTSATLINVTGTTALLTIGLGGVGVIYPKSLESWGGFLLGGLILLILSQVSVLILGAMGLPIAGTLTFLDWVGVILFSALLIFDMNRAMHVTRTVENSIDCAVAVYLDVVNIFLRLLSIKSND